MTSPVIAVFTQPYIQAKELLNSTVLNIFYGTILFFALMVAISLVYAFLTEPGIVPRVDLAEDQSDTSSVSSLPRFPPITSTSRFRTPSPMKRPASSRSQSSHSSVGFTEQERQLYISIGVGNIDRVAELLKNGANSNAINDQDRTPLHIAAHKV